MEMSEKDRRYSDLQLIVSLHKSAGYVMMSSNSKSGLSATQLLMARITLNVLASLEGDTLDAFEDGYPKFRFASTYECLKRLKMMFECEENDECST